MHDRTLPGPLPPPTSEASWQENIRRRELQRQADEIARLASKIGSSEDFTTDTPQKLAGLVRTICDLLGLSLHQAPALDLGGVNVFLTKIAGHLRYVDRARVAQTPWSLVQPAETFLKQQLASTAHFILRPTWAYNYSLVGDFWMFYRSVLQGWIWFPFEDLEKKLPDIEMGARDQIFCISFPRVERSNVLLHCLWGHELGHIIVEKWVNDSFGPLWKSAEPQVRKRLEAQIEKPPVDPLFEKLVIDEISSRQTLATMEAAMDGLTELLCDLIGVHLFGPAALAAAIEFAARFELDAPPLQSGNYPPWRYRLRLMLDHCNADLLADAGIGYPGPVLAPFVDWLNEARSFVVDPLKERTVLRSDAVTKEAYEFIGDNLEEAKASVIAMLPPRSSKSYSLRSRFKRLGVLVRRLACGIPPNEEANLSQVAVSLEDILTSGWICKMRAMRGAEAGDQKADVVLVERLVLKACESSYVHAVWGPKLRGV